MARNKQEALASIRAFAPLVTALQDKLSAVSKLQRIGAGTILFRERERAEYVYGLAEGQLALTSGKTGSEVTSYFVEAGGLVLIPPALLDVPYVVTGTARTDVLALLIRAAIFRDLVATEVALAEAVTKTLAIDWHRLVYQLKLTKHRVADLRLAQYLIDAAGEVAGPTSLTLQSSKCQIAAQIGVAPATLSRTLKGLRRFGVTTRGAVIEIPSVEKLAAFVRAETATAQLRTPPRRHSASALAAATNLVKRGSSSSV